MSKTINFINKLNESALTSDEDIENKCKDFNLVKKESKKLQEDSYEDEIYSDFESNLRDCGYDVERYSDAGMLTKNIGWIVKNPNTGDKLEISVDGSWLDESKKLQEDDEPLAVKLGAIEDYLQEVYNKYGTDDVDTKVLYMNGNDSTEFDWDENNRTCEFMLFYKSTEMGFAKCYVTKEGNIEGYYWLDSGNGEGQKIEPSKFGTEEDAEDFKNDLVSAYDMKNKWDTQVGELSDYYNNIDKDDLKESDNNRKIKIGSKVYWVGAGNEISAEGEVIDFSVDGRMTIKWDDGETNTYSIEHPDIIPADDYDNSVNESENKIDPNNLTTDQLSKLRKDITLNSAFTDDYENSLGIDPKLVQNFFDGYIEYLSEMIQEDIGEDKYDELDNNDWYNYINEYDTLENLEHYYNTIENPFGEGLQESIEIPGYCQEPIDETEQYELYASYGLNKYGMKYYAVKDVNSGNIVRVFMAKNDIVAKRKFRDE